MGKFYDAMQKVNPPDGQQLVHSESRRSRPREYDEALVGPVGLDEEQVDDAWAEDEVTKPTTVEPSVASIEDPSINSGRAPSGHEPPAEPELRVVDSDSEVDRDMDEKPAGTSSMKRLRTDVFRRPIAAAYERIIQRLFAFRESQRESVILVTSAISGEGTSTVARNIATALAQHRNERVLLIDANLRTPNQQAAFGLKNYDGLGDVLLGTTTLTSAIQEDVVPGLCLLTSGRATESPAQLLTVASLHSVILALLSLFDWVIIDGPPATAYPDVATLAAASGGAILVVEAEATRQEVVEEARRVLETSGVDLVGAVLNRRRYHIPGFIYRRL